MGTTQDFVGAVDGGGYKAVMNAPKTPVQLIDPSFVEGIASVLLHGQEKYAANNWMRGMSWVVVLGSIFRHLFAMARGEEMDRESGLPHCLHAATSLMFWHWYVFGPAKVQHKSFDDRVFQTVPVPTAQPSPYAE